MRSYTMSSIRGNTTPNLDEKKEEQETEEKSPSQKIFAIIDNPNNHTQFISINDHTIIANTQMAGLYFIDTKDATHPKIIDDKQQEEKLKSLDIASLSNNQFIRLCRSKNRYFLQVWKEVDNNKFTKMHRIDLPQINSILNSNGADIQHPQFLSTNPIRILFQQKRKEVGAFDIINEVFGNHPVALTLSNDAKKIESSQEYINYVSAIPLQTLNYGRFVAECKNADGTVTTIFNRWGHVEKKLNQQGIPSPDEKYMAIRETNNQVTICAIKNDEKPETLKDITDFRWLVDSSLVYLSNNTVGVFNPQTKENTVLFTSSDSDKEKNLRLSHLTPMRDSANVTFLLGEKIISVTVPHLKALYQKKKEILSNALHKITPKLSKEKALHKTIPNLPKEIAAYTRDFIGISEKKLINMIDDRFIAPSQLPQELQEEIELQYSKLKEKIEESKNDPELLKKKQNQLAALEKLTTAISRKENASHKDIKEYVNAARKEFSITSPRVFKTSSSFNNLLNKISESHPVTDTEQKHTTAKKR